MSRFPRIEDAKKQRQLSGRFIEKFLSGEELGNIRNDSVSLVEKIKSGRYTALQVARAYCKTTAIAHQINSCLHEILFDQALERARELDEYFSKHKATKGPLHGLPVSLKDQFHVKGVDTTMGYVGWIGTYEGSKDPSKVHKVESQVVGELLSLGAVIYCKTSLPQTLLAKETALWESERTLLAFLRADGAYDVHKQLNLSGEPLIPIKSGSQLEDPMGLLRYQELAIQGRDYCAAYSDYWNATAGGGDGQIVDAVIMPVAPHAAVIPGKYYYTGHGWTGYTEAINLLDYSAAAIPVTKADKNIDLFDSEYKPLNDDLDRLNWEAYDADIYDGAPVGLQIVARKHEEEKVWAIAKIVTATLKAAGVN
ncbi:MAG: hypothetical protein M1839_007854 [Geoglossum umbratile]|nr:MAG: hypothetical protein M1839_007854 [Geoglossum umbratile]